MKIFIGSSELNRVEEKVFIYSILKNTSFTEQDIFILDATSRVVKDFFGNVVFQSNEVFGGSTAFSWMRFLIPEICNGKGKAVYVDSDVIAKSDFKKHFEDLVDNADFACVPAEASYAAGLYKRRILKSKEIRTIKKPYLTSVLVINCERVVSKYSFNDLLRLVDQGQMKYSEVMFLSDRFLEKYNFKVVDMDPRFNVLDMDRPDAELVHFTDLKTQPWFSQFNPAGDFWYSYFKKAITDGYVLNVDLERAIRLKTLSKSVSMMPYVQSKKVKLKFFVVRLKEFFVELPVYCALVVKNWLKSVVNG
jgi:lipopolysaccharide biosynthesis glycosyltransferase